MYLRPYMLHIRADIQVSRSDITITVVTACAQIISEDILGCFARVCLVSERDVPLESPL